MKKHRVLKIILIIILLVVIAFIVYFARKFIIINKIAMAQEEFFSSMNYSYRAILSDNENAVFEYSYKDGKMMETLKIGEKINRITWYDGNSKQKILLTPGDTDIIINDNDERGIVTIAENVLQSVTSNDITEKVKNIFRFKIAVEEVDGEECYVLYPLDGILSNTYYFNKQTGRATKCLIDVKEISFEDWNINNVTEETVSKPNVEEYNINSID